MDMLTLQNKILSLAEKPSTIEEILNLAAEWEVLPSRVNFTVANLAEGFCYGYVDGTTDASWHPFSISSLVEMENGTKLSEALAKSWAR